MNFTKANEVCLKANDVC